MSTVIIRGFGVVTVPIGALVLLALIVVERAWREGRPVHLLTHLWTPDLLTEESR